MKSDVYFIKVDSGDSEERMLALKKLLLKTDPFSVYKKGEFIPVKLTIGDSPCIYNVKPEFIKTIVSDIKITGAKPFLFDTSVIYKGERQNAVDHLTLAQSKGFGHNKAGAPFIIADGVFGSDGKEFTVDSPGIHKIKIPSFIGMVDSLVVVSHATGHIVSRYAGAMKNVAMGMSCRPTKQVQHSSLKPKIIKDKCVKCGSCIAICPAKAISFKDGKAEIDPSVCLGCGECLCACKFNAVLVNWHEDPHIFCRRMADVASFILSRFKNKFFITFALDITKECDCISTKDEMIVAKDIGIFASKDPLAIDMAVTDAIHKHKITDYFSRKTDIYQMMFEYASRIGIGNAGYNLINI